LGLSFQLVGHGSCLPHGGHELHASGLLIGEIVKIFAVAQLADAAPGRYVQPKFFAGAEIFVILSLSTLGLEDGDIHVDAAKCCSN
jgi:hypothetical protein